MAWTDLSPVLTDEDLDAFDAFLRTPEGSGMRGWMEIAETRAQTFCAHLLPVSLYPGSVYLERSGPDPSGFGVGGSVILRTVEFLRNSAPEVMPRIYLDPRLKDMAAELFAAGCEVWVMKEASEGPQPGELWKFLALAEPGRTCTYCDFTHPTLCLEDIHRTEALEGTKLASWRMVGWGSGDYQPLFQNHFGTRGVYPAGDLARAYIWMLNRGGLRLRDSDSRPDWGSVSLGNHFLKTVLFPRMAADGFVTAAPPLSANYSGWFASDIEYVTWANPASELLFSPEPPPQAHAPAVEEPAAPEPPRATSKVVDRLLEEHAAKIPVPAPSLPGPMHPLTLVVARYAEDVQWLLDLPSDIRIVVYNKGQRLLDPDLLARIELKELPNRGRESDTYLRHARDYAHADDSHWTAFCQGEPFTHSPDFPALLQRRDLWQDIQPLTWCYDVAMDVPPTLHRTLEDGEWLEGLRVRTELCSPFTMDQFQWADSIGRGFMDTYYRIRNLPRGWSIAGDFFESCGMDELSAAAWKGKAIRFGYGAMFAVRNHRLRAHPEERYTRLIEMNASHDVYGYLFERLWLHLFGLPVE